MSYSAYYPVKDDGTTEDGPFVASGGGWVDWSDWVLEIDGLEECHTLAVQGWAMVDALGTELERLLGEPGDDDLKDVTRHLIEAVKQCPAGCESIIISDGTEPGDDDDDDSEDD